LTLQMLLYDSKINFLIVEDGSFQQQILHNQESQIDYVSVIDFALSLCTCQKKLPRRLLHQLYKVMGSTRITQIYNDKRNFQEDHI
jgi:hypothetical protein